MFRVYGSVCEGVLERGNSAGRVPEGTMHLACGQRKRDGLGGNGVREL